VSNVRLVFVADKPDASGLAGFDLPLVYIATERLEQPIFGANNLSGTCFPAVEGGGPLGALPPHKWKVLFKNGGMGTLYPLFYALRQRALRADAAARASAAAAAHAPAPAQPQQQEPLERAAQDVGELQRKAFVDPNDPSTIYLAQPVGDSDRLPHPAPRYAPNYGRDDERLEGTGLRP
jgi:WW domain-binding protein 2